MKIQPARFAVSLALLQGLTLAAWAQEPSKQPPLEMPKALTQLDTLKPEPSKAETAKSPAEDKDKPKAMAAKKPKVENAVNPMADLVVMAEMGQYKVKAGDTLDRVIQKFYASTPLRSDVLRNALVQNNPQAFVKGNPKTLLAGAQLMLPEPAELIKKIMPSLLTDSATAVAAANTANTATVTAANGLPHGGAAAHQAGHNPGPEINKRNWVRYP